MRKLFKGGNYSRAETIRGNTVTIISISGVDDVKEFRSTQEAFKLLGFTAKEQGNIYKILAGILQVNLFKNPLNISMSLNFPAKKNYVHFTI